MVIYHAFPAALPGGFIGVDIFFVISGYLITGIIVQGLRENTFSLSQFYRRRIQRIIPAVLLVLAFCLLAGWWVLLPYEYAMLGKQTGAAAIFAPNVLFWSEAGYFDTDSRLKPLLHLWSLGVEEQFYLLWPVLLLCITKITKRPEWLIGGLLLLSFGASLLVSADPAALFFLPHFRAWELLLGALLAIAPVAAVSVSLTRVLLSLAGLAMLGAATVLIDHSTPFPGWWALLPAFGAALAIHAGPDNLVNRCLGTRLLVFIGKISFPLYLWHWPLLTFARIMESGEPGAGVRVAAVILSVLLAWLSYRLVETPLRYHQDARVPVLLITALFACGGLGLLVMAKDGFPGRTAAVNDAATSLYWKEWGLHERDDCSQAFAVPGRCLSNGKTPGIAVLGDSHSTNTFFALSEAYATTDTGIVRLGRGGCPPLYGVQISDSGKRDTCLHSTGRHIDWVLAQDSVTTVFLSSMGPMYLNPRRGRFQLRHPDEPGNENHASIFATGLEDTVQRLLAGNKEVVLVIDWPGLGFHPEACVNTRPLRLSAFEPRDCRSPRSRYDRLSRQYRDMLLDIASRYSTVKLWDTTPVFCDQRYCYGMRDGVLLYRDPGHLSLPGSRYLGQRMELGRPGAD